MCSRGLISCALLALLIPLTTPYADDLSADSTAISADSLSQLLKRETKPKEPFVPRFSFYDSLCQRLLSEKLNLRDAVTAGHPSNPGNYLKSEPSQFPVTYAQTPVRTTISPFALSGNRLGALVNGYAVTPFEHFLFPDGMVDMNDMPELSDDNIYLLPGQSGELFGAEHSVASLLTRPDIPTDTKAHTAMLVDRGNYNYSDIRGRYRKHFEAGRELLLGIGYRSSNGSFADTKDASYQYLADYVEPITPRISFAFTGYLYNRNGSYQIVPDSTYDAVDRNRFDRSLKAGISMQDSAGSRRFAFGYNHRRQGSSLNNFYITNFNLIAHGGFVSLEGVRGSVMYKAEANGEVEKWWDGVIEEKRGTGSLLAAASTTRDHLSFAVQAGGRYAENFDFLPTATSVVTYKADKLYVLGSLGYSERAPSQHELYLRYRSVPFTAFDDYDRYADEGNPDLKSEKQIIATLTTVFGGEQSSAEVTLATGKITDAIDWAYSSVTDSLGRNLYFSPINHTLTFSSASLTVKQQLFKLITLRGGGAAFKYESDTIPDRLYRPDYTIFGSGELHVYWRQTEVDLHAYGEAMYSGRYDGYVGTDLGEDVVCNAKLSLGIRRFRMYYTIDNLFTNAFETREYYTNSARTVGFGFTWYFLD